MKTPPQTKRGREGLCSSCLQVNCDYRPAIIVMCNYDADIQSHCLPCPHICPRRSFGHVEHRVLTGHLLPHNSRYPCNFQWRRPQTSLVITVINATVQIDQRAPLTKDVQFHFHGHRFADSIVRRALVDARLVSLDALQRQDGTVADAGRLHWSVLGVAKVVVYYHCSCCC